MMKKKKSRGVRFLLILLVIAALCWAAVRYIPQVRDLCSPLLGGNGPSSVRDDGSNEWNLILVNAKNRVPADYQVELTTLSNGEQVDSRIYPDLQAMFDAARDAGLELFVAAGYRTAEQQQQLLDEKTEEYREEGHSRLAAARLARKWVALPGASEHQLGLAVDINADSEWSDSEELYAWLEENSYKYGFINRYPPDKTAVTGIVNEPWHYRYVGCEAAADIHARSLCLEEYLWEQESDAAAP